MLNQLWSIQWDISNCNFKEKHHLGMLVVDALNLNAAQDSVSSLHHPQIGSEEQLRKRHLNNEVSHSSFGNNQ